MPPEGWLQRKLGDVADVVGGGTPPKGEFRYWNGSIPWVTPTDVTGLRTRTLTDTANHITEEALSSCAARLLPAGTVLMTSRATIGACAMAATAVATNQGFQNLIPRAEVASDYLFYLAQGLRSKLIQLAAGSTFLEISKQSVRNIEVLLPPLTEQVKIAIILSSIDETTEKTEAVLKQLRVTQRAVMQSLLKRGLPGRHEKHIPLAIEWRLGRLEGVTEIPESWRLVRLTSVARLESGHTPSRRNPEYWADEIPWVSLHDSKHLDVPEIFETIQSVSRLGIENSSARILPRGTVVFSRTATIGKCTVLGREMATSQDFANYVCGDSLHNRYLMHLFRNMSGEWVRLMAGSTHKTIYMPVFQELQILLPPKEEQEKIAKVGDLLESRIAAERQALERLRLLKTSLLPALLSGEIRVPLDETAA